MVLLFTLLIPATLAGCSSPAGTAGPADIATEKATVPQTAIQTEATAGSLKGATAMEGIAAQLAAVRSDSAVWSEAYRMFRNMRQTAYVHPPYTDDDAAGVYKFDCLGFVDHVLMNADPAGY